jgi:hypothetical protein
MMKADQAAAQAYEALKTTIESYLTQDGQPLEKRF